jgi:hypothetical protein
MWVSVGVRTAMAGRADEHRVRQRNLAALAAMNLLMEVAAGFSDRRGTDFAFAFGPQEYLVANFMYRVGV